MKRPADDSSPHSFYAKCSMQNKIIAWISCAFHVQLLSTCNDWICRISFIVVAVSQCACVATGGYDILDGSEYSPQFVESEFD